MNTSTLRVAVADDEPIMQIYLSETVQDLGHMVVAAAGDGDELVSLCCELQPNLIITDIKMPRMDGFDAVREIYRQAPLPVIFITGYNDRERIDHAERHFVLVYLVKPIGERELKNAIDSVLQRFQEFTVLLHERGDTVLALADRADIERAKSLLSHAEVLSEADAFNKICDLSRANGVSLAETARSLVQRSRPPG